MLHEDHYLKAILLWVEHYAKLHSSDSIKFMLSLEWSLAAFQWPFKIHWIQYGQNEKIARQLKMKRTTKTRCEICSTDLTAYTTDASTNNLPSSNGVKEEVKFRN